MQGPAAAPAAPKPAVPPKPAAPAVPPEKLAGKMTTVAAEAAKKPTRAPDDTSPLLSRRGWMALAWGSFTAASAAALAATGRFLFPNVLFEPAQKFKAGFPADYGPGESTSAGRTSSASGSCEPRRRRMMQRLLRAAHRPARTSAARRTGSRRRTSSSARATAAASTRPASTSRARAAAARAREDRHRRRRADPGRQVAEVSGRAGQWTTRRRSSKL